jgi:hypothetical protein
LLLKIFTSIEKIPPLRRRPETKKPDALSQLEPCIQIFELKNKSPRETKRLILGVVELLGNTFIQILLKVYSPS